MTIAGLAAVLFRRWYVVLACAPAFALLLLYVLAGHPLYATRGSVLLIEPEASTASALLMGQTEILSPFAAAVERLVNDGRAPFRMNSQAATLAGTGVREGVSVSMPNFGSQWSASFPNPELTIEVVSEDRDRVADRYQQLVRRVQAVTETLQNDQGLPENRRIQAVPRTMDPPISSVGATRQGKARALVGAMLLALGLTLWAATGWDRAAGMRSVSRTRRGPSGATPYLVDRSVASSSVGAQTGALKSRFMRTR